MADPASDLVSIICTSAEALMLERYLIGLGGRLVRFEGADDESRMTMYSISGLSAEVTAPRRGRGK